MKKHFTIGMAGHIDHGKTSLTKALTKVDTDRLKEEKERQISIELGFAPLYEDDQMEVSVIDVPGHERFIRQMIAGVAGIDLVVLVVAADEGVMPQTKEHLEILQFLGVKKGIVAITKMDRVDEDFLSLVQEEIILELEGSIFEDSPVILVDSLSGKGIDELQRLILNELDQLESRDATGAFRLPIDQVFTVKGQGTIVRGTVYEGSAIEGQALLILPKKIETRARQVQVHHKPAQAAYAGQRTAINLSGITKDQIERGDVLVSSEQFFVTNCVDISLKMVKDLEHPVKHRMPVKCHIGTSEVMGKIVFFDRNEVIKEQNEILCQLCLDEHVVTKRGDRFIIRRPSPQETIGGGWVIDPAGAKYRFGERTIEELEKKREGTPEERVMETLVKFKGLSEKELLSRTSVDMHSLVEILDKQGFICYSPGHYTHIQVTEKISDEILDQITRFQQLNPMRQGMNKAEILQTLQLVYPKPLLEYVLETGEANGIWIRKGTFLSLPDFTPHIPNNWRKRVEGLLASLKSDQMQVRHLTDYLDESGIPDAIKTELIFYLQEQNVIVPLDDKYYVHHDIFDDAVTRLKTATSTSFEVSDAKEVLGLSRKYMIPFLEALDSKKLTARQDGKRVWLA
ncbi:selenocysteine-specific translation elongation factor [Peribacillus sp. SCS-155]|uniref:selenocysteine-specific translation elongation factor n=1 Tax=Peribacillus sedimenti TaxID=3115297 RepID=UPI003905AE43